MPNEIPFPQYNPPQQQNPLQMAEQFQGLMNKQQEFEQHQKVYAAQQAFGQLAQQSLDPATGQLDTNKWLAAAAQHPDAAMLYPEMAKKALELGLLDAQKHGQTLQNNKNELDLTAKAFGNLAGKDTITDGDIAGALATVGVGAGRDRQWATQKYLEYAKVKKEFGMTPNVFVNTVLRGSEAGHEALKIAGQTFDQLTTPMNVTDEEGRPQAITKQEFLQRRRFGMAPGGGLAPPTNGQPRQGGEPSFRSPAEPVYTGIAPGEEVFQKGRAEQWDKLRQEVATNSQTANASDVEIQSMLGKLKEMNFDTGLLTPEKLAIAKLALAFDPKDRMGAVRSVITAKSAEEAAKIVGAMETFDKGSIIQKTQALRAAMGPAQKLTDNEFKTFQDALVGLRTTPQGIMQIYKYMQKMNNLVQTRLDFLDEYEAEHGQKPSGRDSVKFERSWMDFVKKHPELYSFERGEK